MLRLSPEAFWRMTPRELACAARALRPAAVEPPRRDALRELMQAFPDKSERAAVDPSS